MLSVDLFVEALQMPRSKNSSGVYRPKYKKNRTSRLFLSAYIRVHVEVRSGYGRVRGVGASPRRRRSNEAIRPRNSSLRIPYCGRDEKNSHPNKKRMVRFVAETVGGSWFHFSLRKQGVLTVELRRWSVWQHGLIQQAVDRERDRREWEEVPEIQEAPVPGSEWERWTSSCQCSLSSRVKGIIQRGLPKLRCGESARRCIRRGGSVSGTWRGRLRGVF